VVALSVLAGTALASGHTVIRSKQTSRLGRILEGPSRFSLYVFCVGTSTRCAGAHFKSFRPLLAHGSPVPAAHSGVKAGKLATRKLSGGRRQVTYYGQPLYLYAGDRKPGQTKGEQRGNGRGSWFVIDTSGRATARGTY
jgi:predicted lipoprotein with Yx(FWY)xxD motif